MRAWPVLVLILALAACRPHGTSRPTSASPDLGERPLPSPLPAIAAYVNGQGIPLTLVRLAAQREQSASPAMYRQALEMLIEREVLFQEAIIRRLRPDERSVDRLYELERARHKDDTAFRAALAAQGLSPDGFRKELAVQQTVRALVLAEEAKIPPSAVTAAEVQGYFSAHPDEFQLRGPLVVSQILVATGTETTREAQRAKADAILARVRRGEDFAKLATLNSDDAASRPNGGKMPALAHGQMPKPFEDAASALSPEQVSDVVESPQGFHIIKLHERQAAEPIPFEHVAAKLHTALLQRKRQQAFDTLRESLKRQARIERNL